MWSLGCVFLELLGWVFFLQGSEDIGFMTLRSTKTLSGSPSSWQLSESGTAAKTHSVGCRLMELENEHIIGRLAFERLLHAIWFLLHESVAERYSAARLVTDLEATTQELEVDLAKDPDCYLYHTLDPTPATLARRAGQKALHPGWQKIARAILAQKRITPTHRAPGVAGRTTSVPPDRSIHPTPATG